MVTIKQFMTFAAELMALLADEGLLTEGFMPLPKARHPLKLKTFKNKTK